MKPEILLRRIKYADGSTGYYLAVNNDGFVTQTQLKAYQYKELKKLGCFKCAETDYSHQKTN